MSEMPRDGEKPADASIAVRDGALYGRGPAFHPSTAYPEYPFAYTDDVRNDAYDLVRESLLALGLDRAAQQTPRWNPLGDYVGRGQRILIKPNLVLDTHPKGGDLECLITHPSVIRALLDYAYIALEGEGEVIIGDSPIQGTNFEGAIDGLGLKSLVAFYNQSTKLRVHLVDFRQVVADMDERFHVRSWKEVEGDPDGYAEIDLADESALAAIAQDVGKFRVSNYKVSDTLQYHDAHMHKYVVAGSVLCADLIINVPKMKTHCKAGVTLGLKNFVGTVGRKQCLAHHRVGSRLAGGDEYPKPSLLKRISEQLERWIDGNEVGGIRALLQLAYRVNERLIRTLGINNWREGCWHGNDTVWRMVVDLVRIAMYGTRGGEMLDKPQRAILTVIDGIVAGENEGPLEATPKRAGCIVSSPNPLIADLAATTLMGFDVEMIPLLRETRTFRKWPIASVAGADILVSVCGERLTLSDLAKKYSMSFVAAAGWIGHIERRAR